MEKEKLAYLAGIIDGEGCLHIRVARPKKAQKFRGINGWHVITIEVSNTNPRLAEWLKENFKGYFYEVKPKAGRWSTAWNWITTSRNANNILELILPYLVLKRGQAEAMIECYKTKVSCRYHMTQEIVDTREYFRRKVSELNRKYRKASIPLAPSGLRAISR